MPITPGFIGRHGTGFELGGNPLTLVGGNNYYLGYASETMIEAVFALAVKLKLNVLRTWAFIDCGPARQGSPPSGAKNGVYFQYWNLDTGAPDFNEGPDGLQHLDQAIALAESYGLRLILPFTNNWPDFGGVDQYLKWFGLSGHDQFFRDPDTKLAYRNYVRHLLMRVNTRTGRLYMDEPAILAWELINEPRCVDDQGHPMPDSIDTLLAWIREMSAFVKSLDRNHLTCVGDEGFFNRTGAGANALYNGAYGVDCERILAIPTVDFGTCHLYPTYAPQQDAITFGRRWIREHIEAAQRADKPMLIEEYGYAISDDADQLKERDIVFKQWLDQVLQTDGAGAALWMMASVMDSGQLYPNYDHYTVYSAEDVPSILSFSETARGRDITSYRGRGSTLGA